jgi:hypothetical protein
VLKKFGVRPIEIEPGRKPLSTGTRFATCRRSAYIRTSPDSSGKEADMIAIRKTESPLQASSPRKRSDRRSSRRPVGTVVGSAMGAAVVLAAAEVLGAGVVAFAMSVAVGTVLGGWMGRRFSQRRAQAAGPRDTVRRRRSIRIQRITRTMRRRLGREPRSHRSSTQPPRLAKVVDQ